MILCRLEKPVGGESASVSPVHLQIEHISCLAGFVEYSCREMYNAHLSDDVSILLGNKVPGVRVKESLQCVEPGGTVDDEGDHPLLFTVSGEIFYPAVIGISGRADVEGAHDVRVVSFN